MLFVFRPLLPLLLSACLLRLPMHAAPFPPVEGMWVPVLLQELNLQEMKAMGFELEAEALFSNTQPSLKDAVVWFNQGCTGVMLSDQGLLLTNHHCGFDAIQNHSSPENNRLKNGFWAASVAEELPNPDLVATFIVSIEDVTARLMAQLGPDALAPDAAYDAKRAAAYDAALQKAGKALIAEATQGTHHEGFIRSFFAGNRYFLFITETFRDVRLVGTPPNSIGKFGADADNWMWPRHTGDFSLFRIYAGPDGKPAAYSPANQPWKPRRVAEIDLKGVQEGDFTLVYGFPGRTDQYLPSPGLELVDQHLTPLRIELRTAVLNVLDEQMRGSEDIHIKYAAKQAGIANAWKKWIGQQRGLARLNSLERKRAHEAELKTWADAQPRYRGQVERLLKEYASLCDSLRELETAVIWITECANRVECLRLGQSCSALVNAPTPEARATEAQKLGEGLDAFMREYDKTVDGFIAAEMLPRYAQNAPKAWRGMDSKLEAALLENERDAIGRLWGESILDDPKQLKALLAEPKGAQKAAKRLAKDPLYLLAVQVNAPLAVLRPRLQALYARQRSLDRSWQAIVLAHAESRQQRLYPDANSTLRVAYGKVEGYVPFDGAQYTPFTTLDGVMEKENPKVEEFTVEPRLRQLHAQRNYGRYANAQGRLPLAFLASNHTSGGNSGSPVFNGRGQLVGLNFDRTWESTMSDYHYSPERCRNIAVDIRYILFVMDKFAGAQRLMAELRIVP